MKTKYLVRFILYHELEPFPFPYVHNCIDIKAEKQRAPYIRNPVKNAELHMSTILSKQQPGSQRQVDFKDPVQILFFGGEICNYFIDLSNDCAK